MFTAARENAIVKKGRSDGLQMMPIEKKIKRRWVISTEQLPQQIDGIFSGKFGTNFGFK